MRWQYHVGYVIMESTVNTCIPVCFVTYTVRFLCLHFTIVSNLVRQSDR